MLIGKRLILNKDKIICTCSQMDLVPNFLSPKAEQCSVFVLCFTTLMTYFSKDFQEYSYEMDWNFTCKPSSSSSITLFHLNWTAIDILVAERKSPKLTLMENPEIKSLKAFSRTSNRGKVALWIQARIQQLNWILPKSKTCEQYIEQDINHIECVKQAVCFTSRIRFEVAGKLGIEQTSFVGRNFTGGYLGWFYPFDESIFGWSSCS